MTALPLDEVFWAADMGDGVGPAYEVATAFSVNH
jgi:hypothetical protein